MRPHEITVVYRKDRKEDYGSDLDSNVSNSAIIDTMPSSLIAVFLDDLGFLPFVQFTNRMMLYTSEQPFFDNRLVFLNAISD